MTTDSYLPLKDIEGLKEVSLWPLATGWWIVIILSIIIISFLAYIIFRKLSFNYSWKKEILNNLSKMEKDINEVNIHEIIIELSELLRRIAIHRYPRNQCAGLKDNDWLLWLEEHDPKKFKWLEKGNLIIKAPYSPPSAIDISLEMGKTLIRATKEWVK